MRLRRLFYRAHAYSNLHKYQEAIDDLNKYIDLIPANENAWINRGWNLAKLGRHEEALDNHAKALEFNPKNDGIRINQLTIMKRYPINEVKPPG